MFRLLQSRLTPAIPKSYRILGSVRTFRTEQELTQMGPWDNNQGHKEVYWQDFAPCRVAVLNRPKALNSLNLPMVRELQRLYEEWEVADHIHCILVKGPNDAKAFCAGGDVKGVIQNYQSGQTQEALRFFEEEYRLNWEIKTLWTPYVALIDKIVMGGGCGLSMHGPYRVCTEKTVLAMPECGIGFFPDVGGSHFLSQMDHNMGVMLALTGHRLKGLDVKLTGLATHFVPSDMIGPLLFRLRSYLEHTNVDFSHTEGLQPSGSTRAHDMVSTVLAMFEPSEAFRGDELYAEGTYPDDSVMLYRHDIERVFGAATVEEIVQGVEEAIGEALSSLMAAYGAETNTEMKAMLEGRAPPRAPAAEAGVEGALHQRFLDGQVRGAVPEDAKFLPAEELHHERSRRLLRYKFWVGARAGIDKGCPLALKVTLKQIRTAKERQYDLRQCLKMEYAMLQHFLEGGTFAEGVRALLIDKDQKPRWEPATLEEVDDAMVNRYFRPAARMLDLPRLEEIPRGIERYKEWYDRRIGPTQSRL